MVVCATSNFSLGYTTSVARRVSHTTSTDTSDTQAYAQHNFLFIVCGKGDFFCFVPKYMHVGRTIDRNYRVRFV